ncbi:hypothetical protein P3S38_29120, partial [Enterobacter hormaechei]|uniref:hypothetical protein n=1 Tax=Enterobacter hormaechei TaxID=158836 RepID=UPI0023E45ABE
QPQMLEAFCFKNEVTDGLMESRISQSLDRSQRNDNFIDKTFTIVADILLQIIPMASGEKKAFTYYRDGVI